MSPASGLFGRFGAATTLAYLGTLGAALVAAALLGDLPTGLGRRGSPVALAPALVLAVGLVGVFVAAGDLPRYLRIVRSDRVGTGSAAGRSGRVALAGSVDAADPIEPPLGDEAVACVVRVSTQPFEAENPDWRARDTTERTAAFGVDDGTGVASVDPGDARLALRDPERRTFPPTRELPAPVAAHLDGLDVGVDRERHRIRVAVRALRPGDEAFVVGRAGQPVAAGVVAAGDYPDRLRGRLLTAGGLGSLVSLAGLAGLFLVSGVV